MVYPYSSATIYCLNIYFLLVRITKVTTKIGDNGKTNLGDGSFVSKSSHRVCAFGSIDSLNSFIGWASVVSSSTLQNKLKKIQQDLFNIGGELSLPNESLNLIKVNRLEWLESEINHINKKLPPLKEFILPNGNELCTRIHIARTECRNAERDLVKLSESEKVPPLHNKYLNRLSDYFFVLARAVHLDSNDNEIIWDHKK